MSEAISRRQALTLVAAVPAAVAVGLMGASTLLAAPTKRREFPVPIEHDWYGPRFPQGHIAIVDRDLKPKDDDLVYARFRFPDHPKMNFEKLLPFWVTRRKGREREVRQSWRPSRDCRLYCAYGYRPQRLRQWRGRDRRHCPLFGEP